MGLCIYAALNAGLDWGLGGRVEELSLLKKIGLYTAKNCIFLFSCCYIVVLIYRFVVRYVCVFNRNELFEIYSNMNLLVILHGVVQFYE